VPELHTPPRRALACYEGLDEADLEPLGAGLINDTYLVSAPRGRFVLQRVSAIFDPRIHENIEAVTSALEAAAVPTPKLVAAREGQLFVTVDGTEGVFRVMTYIDGASFDASRSPAQARSAGLLVGRFHRALDGLDHEFVGRRLGVHDTAKHLALLEETLARGFDDHRLFAEVEGLGQKVLSTARGMPPLPVLPERPCHGDLKLNNVRFRGPEPPESDEALCLVDLDTLAPMQLAHELGDGWRSWCNRSGEDSPAARLDLEVFAESLEGYLDGIDRSLAEEERLALLLGPEWVSLELVARFAADALRESYFGWDRQRHPGAGEHNLVRARGQHSVFEAFVASRRERAEVLRVRVP